MYKPGPARCERETEWTGAYIEIPEESLGINHEDLDTTPLKASHIRASRALLERSTNSRLGPRSQYRQFAG